MGRPILRCHAAAVVVPMYVTGAATFRYSAVDKRKKKEVPESSGVLFCCRPRKRLV